MLVLPRTMPSRCTMRGTGGRSTGGGASVTLLDIAAANSLEIISDVLRVEFVGVGVSVVVVATAGVSATVAVVAGASGVVVAGLVEPAAASAADSWLRY